MKVIIVGAGFGGLRLARKLNKKPGMEVTLVDRFNYHQFQPLFYQVATAGLDASNISFPLRKAFHNSPNVRLRLATLEQIIPAEKKVITDNGELPYDALVIATGAGTNFFGNAQLAAHTFPMKSTVEALQLRNRLIQNFEDAAVATDPLEKEALLTVVVVGGGATGVEVSGAIADMRKYVLHKYYPELDFSTMKIYLLEGSSKTLAAMSQQSSQQSQAYLGQLGVNVITAAVVQSYDGKTVQLQDGKTISSKTVIWAAGIKGNIPNGIQPDLIARGNRIRTNRYNQLPTDNSIFAIGDVACMETALYPNGHPQVAQTAIQQADNLAKNLAALQSNSGKLREFEYADKGSMATVGRNLAVVDVPKPKLHFGGFLAWIIWMSLHLMLILGVKNRFFVFCNWLYNYITRDQSLRLILKGIDTPSK